MLSSQYNKFIAALLTGILAWATTVVQSASSAITAGEWITLAGVIVVAVEVYLIGNAPATPPSLPSTSASTSPSDVPLTEV